MTGPAGWAWAAVAGAICGLIGLDLLASRRPGTSRAVLLSAAWVGAGIGFGLILAAWQGADTGQQYFAAYLLEKTLSVDNLFVFVLVFQAFGVPAAAQHRVLLAGVAGALVLRGGLIAGGAALLTHLSWALYAFGAVLLVAAVRMARGGVRLGPRQGLVQRGLRVVIPVTECYVGLAFLTRRDGRLAATPLLAALIAIEAADLVFAVDSIPAALGVTTDTFVVFTANAFAVLGLRALYLVLAGAVERLRYLRQGMAVLLAFIGAKLLLSPVLHVPAAMSLGVIVAIIAAAAALSLLPKRPPAARRGTPEHVAPEPGAPEPGAPEPGAPALPRAARGAERVHA